MDAVDSTNNTMLMYIFFMRGLPETQIRTNLNIKIRKRRKIFYPRTDIPILRVHISGMAKIQI